MVGIATDRDLAVRALGRALDPNTTTLAQVMSASTVTLSPSDDRADAISLMRQHNIRRIPLVVGERVVGIVTLDDLLLDEAAPLDGLAAIVETQLGEGGPAESRRSPAQQRRAARVEATLRRLLKQVRQAAELKNTDQAETALLTVLHSVIRRLTPEQASDFIAQLPSLLHSELRALPRGPDKAITRESIEADLAQQLEVDSARSAEILALLLARGIKYDHSLMHNDFHPYYVRVGDTWTKIDYSKHLKDWMKPLERGQETDLIEIPANWYLDDLPPMMFIKASPNSHGFVSPRHLGEMWKDQFDWVYRENDYAVFTMTIHPDVSGRPQVLMMLERLIGHMLTHEGVRSRPFNEIADDFARRTQRK